LVFSLERLEKIGDSIQASIENKVRILETHKNKRWFDQELSELASKRKQENLLWLQYPNNKTAEDSTNISSIPIKPLEKINVITCKLKDKLYSKQKYLVMYKGINDFKKGYRPRAYVIKIYEAIL